MPRSYLAHPRLQRATIRFADGQVTTTIQRRADGHVEATGTLSSVAMAMEPWYPALRQRQGLIRSCSSIVPLGPHQISSTTPHAREPRKPCQQRLVVSRPCGFLWVVRPVAQHHTWNTTPRRSFILPCRLCFADEPLLMKTKSPFVCATNRYTLPHPRPAPLR